MRRARLLGRDQVIDDGPAPVGAGRDQAQAGDDAGHLVGQGHRVDVVGPAHVAGLDGQVQLVADVRPGRAAVGGRAVPGPGIADRRCTALRPSTPTPRTLALRAGFFGLGTDPSSINWVSVASPSKSTVTASPCRAPQVSTSVPSTATELGLRNSSGTAAWASRLANHLASTPDAARRREPGPAW